MLIADGVGERLREERARLKMNQTAFGLAAGVSRGTQKAYELGDNSPDVRYLDALQALGVDVFYVLTGAREAVETGELTPAESALLSDSRRLNESQRSHTSESIYAMAEMAGRYKVNGDK